MKPLDKKDSEILARRTEMLNAVKSPRVGDWVRFADGTLRRISYIWPDGVQTSDGGSYYLAGSFVSMSGGLYPSVPHESLRPTDELKPGAVWFFHHNQHEAHNGVDASLDFRVYECGLRPVANGWRYE
jgi:hypothetical protein